MKGPEERLKYDLRRVWECPACQHRERTGGEVGSLFCRCQVSLEPVKRRAMRLVEDGARRAFPARPFTSPEYAPADFPDQELPTPAPAATIAMPENATARSASEGETTLARSVSEGETTLARSASEGFPPATPVSSESPAVQPPRQEPASDGD